VRRHEWNRTPFLAAARCFPVGRILARLNLLLMVVSLGAPVHAYAQQPLPILDLHLHARNAPDHARALPPRLCLPASVYGAVDPKCSEPLVAPATDEEMVARTIEILERRNVFGVISDDALETRRRFRQAAPDRLIPACELDLDGESLSAARRGAGAIPTCAST
jgi:uncharacterized protein